MIKYAVFCSVCLCVLLITYLGPESRRQMRSNQIFLDQKDKQSRWSLEKVQIRVRVTVPKQRRQPAMTAGKEEIVGECVR